MIIRCIAYKLQVPGDIVRYNGKLFQVTKCRRTSGGWYDVEMTRIDPYPDAVEIEVLCTYEDG